MASLAADVARKTFRELHGVVVTAGLMQKTVKVRVGGRKWNGFLQKYFNDPKTYLVHDPQNSLREGDVVTIVPGFVTSQHKRHVVKHIIKPAGVPIEERPAIPTLDELWGDKDVKKAAKDARRAMRQKIERIENALDLADRMVRRTRREVALYEKRIIHTKEAADTTVD
ncbi:hypothetical protein B0H67DRAFT_550469 [Lasiosphaeris hirsuta]|uniref:Ribosomal protein S17 n=1 Tax=Lasiosphaeris hirsuta TaxID=260670 RepID=A0AA40E2L5_9PEZI|nr:hypothetical protein B0H67DRAFT_550469 [Lasiosphaeris hirsuta]